MSSTQPNPATLIADLRHRATVSVERVDRDIMLCAADHLDRIYTADVIAPNLPSIADDERLAIAGTGPEFRLRMAAKTIRCPRCKQVATRPCFNGRSCKERVWALAALRRRDRVTPEKLADLRRDLAADPTNTSIIRAAIDAGLLRLERAEDGAPRWVDVA